MKGFSILEVLIYLLILSLISYSSLSFVFRFPQHIISLFELKQFYFELLSHRLNSTYFDNDILISTDQLPPSFFFESQNKKIGFKPYCKSFHSNTISHHKLPYEITLSPGTNVLHLKPMPD